MLPSLSDYMQTFQNPQLFLTDKELAKCTCPKDQQGQPLVQSGGFALTFKLESAGSKWAVRCFHRDAPLRDKRYSLIAAKLQESAMRQSGYFVAFEYQAQGVVVKGQKYPIVKMAWAGGETLGSFLEKNYGNKTNLLNLQKSLQELRGFLATNGIAHGDIQPGNIMVADSGRKLQLIDYDGMFVPGMANLNASESGVPNFQHPKRQQTNPWNVNLDRFPFIVLDIALSILADNPQYWTKTSSSDEKIIFETTDYLAPLGSAIFNELKADARYSQKIAALQQICLSDFAAIPPADAYIGFKAVQSPTIAAAQAQPVEIWYKGNFKVVSATDIAAIQMQEGNVVEIVGCISEIHNDSTRGGRPYCFLNFAPWQPRATTFRLVLWSEVLAQFAKMGIHSVSTRLKGQYISITGLVVNFTNKWGTTYQIVPAKASAINIIDMDEAEFRLGKRPKILKQHIGGTLAAKPSSSSKTNADILTGITGRTANIKHAPTIKATPKPHTSNAEKLKSMQSRSGQWQASSPSRTSTSKTRQNSFGATSSTTSYTPSQPNAQPSWNPKPSSSTGCLIPLVAILATALALGTAIAATVFH